MKKTFVAMLVGALMLPALAMAEGTEISSLKKRGALTTMGAGVVGKVKGTSLKSRGKAKVRKGKANVARGQKMTDRQKGDALEKKGRAQITRGNKMIQAGRRQKKAGDMAFEMGKGMVKSKLGKKTKVTEAN